MSLSWENRPLKFIGQIRLNDFYNELEALTLAYIFITQPKDKADPFFDPDIISPNEGENAVIIESDHILLLQLHTNWLPFYINAGGSPTMFIFLNGRKDGGFLLIEDI